VPTNFTVTAANGGGSSQLTLSLSAASVLLNYGARCLQESTATFPSLAVSGGNVLSEDCAGFTQHWVLWSYSSGTILAQGDACPVATCIDEGVGGPVNVELAGQIAVVPYIAAVGQGMPPAYDNVPMGFQILSATDGHVVATVTPSGGVAWWRVAPDGSYICGAAGADRNLTVWAPDGSVITTRPGNYTSAVAYCAPGQVRVATGPAGTNVIEMIAVPSGASSVSPAFAGTFSSWFGDGSAFLSNVTTTVWVYSPSAAQHDLSTLSTSAGLAGWGPWFWTFDGTTLTIYKVGASASPTATYTVTGGNPATVAISASTIAILDTQLRIIDLSGAAPSETDYSPPIAGVAYAAASASQWVLGNSDGALLDGASLGGTPRYFGYGALRSLAGSQSRLAVATSIGKVLIFRTSDSSLSFETTLDFSAAQLAISADGSVLALRAAGSPNLSGVNDDSVHTVSLPSGTVINTWPYTNGAGPYAVDITLSSSGALLGQVLNSPMRQVTSSSGGAVLWSDSGSSQPVRLSLDDMLIAAASSNDSNAVTTIYLNDVKSSAVSGWAVGWLQGDYILQQVDNPAAAGAVFSSAGIKQSGPSLPVLGGPLQVLSADSVYDSSSNAIYSLSRGAKRWSTSLMLGASEGVVSGSSVAFVSGNQLLIEPY
jgi:hypothetical protein